MRISAQYENHVEKKLARNWLQDSSFRFGRDMTELHATRRMAWTVYHLALGHNGFSLPLQTWRTVQSPAEVCWQETSPLTCSLVASSERTARLMDQSVAWPLEYVPHTDSHYDGGQIMWGVSHLKSKYKEIGRIFIDHYIQYLKPLNTCIAGKWKTAM